MVDQIQNKALRLCLGAMNSSPCQALHAEARILPLFIRRKSLAAKYIMKIRNRNKDLSIQLNTLTSNCLTNLYWSKRPDPPLVEAFMATVPYADLLSSKDNPSIFQLQY